MANVRDLPLSGTFLSGYERVKVDVAQTSFYEGREFRAYYELSEAVGSTLVIKAVVPIDIILTSLAINLDLGQVRLETVVGGTEGGSFASPVPKFGRNNMSVGPNRKEAYVSQVLLTYGGTHSGGTVIDVIRLKTAGNSAQAVSVGASASDERGVGANTYYFRLAVIGNDILHGTFKVSWEERP